ncbi:acetyl-CoA carboxylase [Nocardioides baekrokdamisoli]|uniref:Acetyl-CoA carboxylase n=1 Tax=Nocardioides baekrokdamisoli TaxID=1804624 RepID=A0A3G9IUJ2_9ACTN|nr:carboxyl transferase domain-containing protein [Nocardioides baekrokdamisoli]BBH17311.1 acetyl-CoA carboxylase [Nocardioides baekrokdamisoli]
MPRVTARDLIGQLFDSWESWDVPASYVGLPETYSYELATAAHKAGVDESVLTGEAVLGGIRVAVLVSEFGFLAGSVGRAASERLIAAIERATAEGLPLIGLPCSGGTRMQEGTPAFVQMVRIGAAIAAHRAAHLPYVVWLRNPTTGGVMATWASLGQIVWAEPGALAGFLGPRVYEAIHGEPFPEGVQVAENLAARGVIDEVVPLASLRSRLIEVTSVLAPPAGPRAGELSQVASSTDPDAWDSILTTRSARRPGIRELLTGVPHVPLSGTQAGEADPGILLAVARFGDQPCVVAAQDRAMQARTPFGPAGLRTVRRGIQLASELGVPLVTVIDTRGAALSAEAENGAMAGEIARTLSDLVSATCPTVSVMLGEGNGGGALAILPADRIIATEAGWLSPLPPEGASAIVHRDIAHADQMARAQKVRVQDLPIDVFVPEGERLTQRVRAAIGAAVAGLVAGTAQSRADRFA